jgi:hypothetical protein
MLYFEPEGAQKFEPQHPRRADDERVNGYFLSVEARMRDATSEDKRYLKLETNRYAKNCCVP